MRDLKRKWKTNERVSGILKAYGNIMVMSWLLAVILLSMLLSYGMRFQDEKRLIAEAWLLIVSLSFEYPMPSSSHLSVTGMLLVTRLEMAWKGDEIGFLKSFQQARNLVTGDIIPFTSNIGNCLAYLFLSGCGQYGGVANKRPVSHPSQ